MDNLIITTHAKERFVERFSKLAKSVPKNPEQAIRKLLSKAVPEDIDPVHRVVRLINNGGCLARYFHYAGWRFVVIDGEEGQVLATIERKRGAKS